MFFPYALFQLISLFSSCSDKEDPDGKWDDNIKLSTKSAEFSAGADSITITTEGTWWWINYITVNSKTYYYDNEDADRSGLYNYSFQGGWRCGRTPGYDQALYKKLTLIRQIRQR